MYLQESNIITLQNTCYVTFTTENCNLSHYSVCSKIFKSLFPSSGCAGREVEAQTLAPWLVSPRLPNCLRRRFWCEVGLQPSFTKHPQDRVQRGCQRVGCDVALCPSAPSYSAGLRVHSMFKWSLLSKMAVGGNSANWSRKLWCRP